jgi:hypothetical protein
MNTTQLLAMISLLISQPAMATARPCDQRIYDIIYRRIVLITISSKQLPKDIDEKNDAIETIRALCRGQRSTYEGAK